MRFEYPIALKTYKEKDKTEAEIQEAAMERYYGHNNQLGFYPVGRLNGWHGGIHIETANAEVTAIADGRVIAYRIGENYLPEDKDSQHPPYSNSFMLIQHSDYESPKGQKLTFYSLYNHMLPEKHMEDSGKVPDFYAKYTGEVKTNSVARGTIVRRYEPKVKDTYPDKGRTAEYKFIPRGSAVTEVEDVTENHWTKTVKGYKGVYKVCTFGNEKLCINKNYLINKGGNNRIVKHTANEKDRFSKEPATGSMIYNAIEGSYVGMACSGEVHEVEYTKNKGWIKLKKVNQFMMIGDFKPLKKELKDDVVTGSVQNVDVKIDAGTVIGYTGNYGFKGNAHYTGVHLEVFSADSEVENFFNNKLADNDRTQYETKPNATLQVGKPVTDLKKDTTIKVLQQKGDYVQIGFENIEGVVPRTHLGSYSSNVPHFPIKSEHFDSVNKIFHNSIKDKSAKLYWITKKTYVKKQGDSYVTISKTENGKLKREDQYRRLLYKPARTGEKFWIKKDHVSKPKTTQQTVSTLTQKPAKGLGLNFDEGTTPDPVAVPVATPPKSFAPYWGKLVSDVILIYEEEPTEGTTDIQVAKKMKVKRKITTTKDTNDKEWWKVRGQYEDDKGNKQSETGWIQKSELVEVNPYNWEDFGWQLKPDTGNQYFYQFNANEGEKPHAFIEKIWELVDLPEQRTQPDGTVVEVAGDKVLTQLELQRAMRDKRKINILSKLICKHQNEWDTWKNITTFKDEVMALYEKGIELEEDAEEKQKLEEIRDERIALLEEKIKHLCFWQDIQDGEVAEAKTFPNASHRRAFGNSGTPLSNDNKKPETPKEEKPKRTFPVGDSMVWHFHPIAFVEHMKLITAPTTPPWIEVALAEAKKAKGVFEDQAPLTKMIKKYHNHCKIFDSAKTKSWIEDSYQTSWCSSFVSWCLDQTNYKGLKQSGSRFYIADDPKWNGTGEKSKRYKLKAKDMLVKVSEPLFGSIAVFSDCTKEGVNLDSGHITFVYGTVKGSEQLAVLGGNQGNMLKVSPYDCSGNVFVSWREKDKKTGKIKRIHYKKFRGFYMPKNYKSGIPLGEEHHYNSFEEANKKATTIEIKTNKDGESS